MDFLTSLFFHDEALNLMPEAYRKPVPEAFIKRQAPTLDYLVETAKEYEKTAIALVRTIETMKRNGTPENAIFTLSECKRKADRLGRNLYAVLKEQKADLVMDDAVNELARMGLSPYRVSSLGLPVANPEVKPFTPWARLTKQIANESNR